MKIVHVSAYDLPGQRFNGMVIHRNLLSDGHESDYLVDRKYSKDARVHSLGPWPLRRVNRLAKRWEAWTSRQSDLCVLGLGALTQRSFRLTSFICNFFMREVFSVCGCFPLLQMEAGRCCGHFMTHGSRQATASTRWTVIAGVPAAVPALTYRCH